MQYWKALTFGRACAYVAVFAVVSAIIRAAFFPALSPESAAGQIAGSGLVLLGAFVVQARNTPKRRLWLQSAVLVALIAASGLASVEAVDWLR